MGTKNFDEVHSSMAADFVSNETLQALYELEDTKTFDEQFSPVSFEAQMLYTIALAIDAAKAEINHSIQEIEKRQHTQYLFSEMFYGDLARSFQYGDKLVFDTESKYFRYETIDESKQIIKHVRVREIVTDRVTTQRFYVAKAGKQALSIDELSAFKYYIHKLGGAGIHYDYVSKAANKLRLEFRVWYNPLVLGANGQRLSGGGNPVDEAVEAYLAGIGYGDSFNRTRCIDAIQLADGVDDVVLDKVELDGIEIATQRIESDSGFFAADTIDVKYVPFLDK